MAKDKSFSNAPKKATKKVAAKVTANKPVAGELAAAAAQLSTPVAHTAAQSAQPSTKQLQDEIRHRAYELFRERGGQHGSHESDWHRAESEVRSKYKA